MHKKTNKTVKALMACLAVCLGSSAVYAADPAPRDFRIEPQSVSKALKAFAAQADMQLIFTEKDAGGAKSAGVTGTKSAREALQEILKGTGLEFEFTANNVVVVRKASAAVLATKSSDPPGDDAKDPRKEGKSDSSSGFRVGQVDQGAAGPQVTSDQKKEKEEPLSEIVVTGTRIAGVGPVGSPVKVYTREDINQSGAATVNQFARQMLENFSSNDTLSSNNPNTGYAAGGAPATNTFQGAGFNLHGIGPSATLTLLNGQRLAPSGLDGSFADISQIPLSAIDHIEVLPDGASAIYGADAEAGVVNIITRKDFEGAETGLRYGAATEGGADERTASQLVGHSWSTGNALLSYEYDNQSGLYASKRSYIPDLGGPYALIPRSHRNSIFGSADQNLGDQTTISANVLYSDREFGNQSYIDNDFYTQSIVSTGSAKQLSATLAVDQKLLADWHATLKGNYTKARQASNSDSVLTAFSTIQNLGQLSNADSSVFSVDALTQGSLASLPAGQIKAAFGATARTEKFLQGVENVFGGVASNVGEPSLQRHVASLSAELYIPLIGQANAISGAKRLELSLAGRYDHYSDFGSTTNPKLGLLWTPVVGLNIRGTFGTSFQAPLLSQIGQALFLDTFPIADSATQSGVTDTLLVQGGNPNLGPEKSRSYTAGFDIKPQSLERLSLAVNYFHIAISGRVGQPPVPGGFGNLNLGDSEFAPFIMRNPPLSTVLGYFNNPAFGGNNGGAGPADVKAIFDGRLTNLANTIESGLDLTLQYAVPTVYGQLNFNLAVERLLKNEIQIVYTVPFLSLLNTYAEPPKWKGRSGVSWTQGSMTASLFINYVNAYQNTLFTPSQSISSWTTGDLYFAYRTGAATPTYLARNLTIALSINNVTDKKPPTALIPSALNFGGTFLPYDPANTSPVGRLVSLSVTKGW